MREGGKETIEEDLQRGRSEMQKREVIERRKIYGEETRREKRLREKGQEEKQKKKKLR